MITDKELNEVSLSPTKKDYYQIWNELIELASKISSRWSPDSTNESDPGIVLLKSLVAIADKLNYNIDKNTLEAFMPSATQQESMRKLTEMMGYSMKYYQSATCKVNIACSNPEIKQNIYFPKFVNLKNEDEDINYVTLEDFTLQEDSPSYAVKAIEGELIECETNTDNIVTIAHLDDNHRYILPETNVAENGIFICNIYEVGGESRESEYWKQVDNLNTQLPGAHVFKFGFDSNSTLPYIQFPDDISQLIKDGIRIKYIRTNGLMGNIARGILSKLEIPSLWSTAEEGDSVKDLTAADFTVTNISAAINGSDPESLNSAYNGFKKTIGTFDTLVTCRDYMNKIYQLTASATDTTPLVSNVIVSDIRDDINRAITLCSFDEYGICYEDKSLPTTATSSSISHFDLVLYPFKTIYSNSKEEYINSFKYSAENNHKIAYDIAKQKTIAHNFVDPLPTELLCIKNYLRLKAKITTIKRVTSTEEAEILSNIYMSIYENFNCHQIDFGEEIPYDTILKVIKEADTRIKDVSLDEPSLYTMIVDSSNNEYALTSTKTGEVSNFDESIGDQLYNKLVLRNILAGRIAAFQYDNNFKTSYTDTKYPDENLDEFYPGTDKYITKLTSYFKVNNQDYTEKELELKDNEVIQFRRPNLTTKITYPCYVNYYVKLNGNANDRKGIPATFITVYDFMARTTVADDPSTEEDETKTFWDFLANSLSPEKLEETDINSPEKYKSFMGDFKGWLFTKESGIYKAVKTTDTFKSDTTYYSFTITQQTFGNLNSFIAGIGPIVAGVYDQLQGLYRSLGADSRYASGKLVDSSHVKYTKAYTHASLASPLLNYFVQQTHDPNSDDVLADKVTQSGLGQDASYSNTSADYMLKRGEYLLINYTDTKNSGTDSEEKIVINKEYKEGTIIGTNFKLIDSELYHNNHSYSKTDGFTFEIAKPEGMFTLDTNEQICIKEPSMVKLNRKDSQVFWIRNDDDSTLLRQPFTYDEYYYDKTYSSISGYKGGIPKVENPVNFPEDYEPNAYMLKDNEAFFYTDTKKQDLFYYGAGSIIMKSEGTPTLYKELSDAKSNVSLDDIMTYGIDKIPWGFVYQLNADNKMLYVIESQYISLTAGDKLKYITNSAVNPAEFSLSFIDNSWQEVKSANYKFAENDSYEDLPQVDIPSLSWWVRSRLDFNMGPENPQILDKNDSIVVDFNDGDPVELKPLSTIESSTGELKYPLSVYSNINLQTTIDNIKFENNNLLKLKLSENIPPVIKGSITEDSGNVTLNNYENGNTTFTKFSFETIPEGNRPLHEAFTLNIKVPENETGLIMFYYVDANAGESGHTNAYLKVKGTGAKIKRFNSNDTARTTFSLIPDTIQVLEFDHKATALEIYADTDTDADKAYKSTIIFGDLDLVVDINPKLNYRYSSTGSATGLSTLLKDIKDLGEDIANKFYYNTPVDNSNAIDLNPLVEDDTMANPYTWYDANNMANKFVISEIDATYLPTGITLTKASKV